jgi:hypothetical protein
MHTDSRLPTFFFGILVNVLAAEVAKPAFIFNLTQDQNGVELSGSGKLDLSGLKYYGPSTSNTYIFPSYGLLVGGPAGGEIAVDEYSGVSGPATLGMGANEIPATGGSGGNIVGVANGNGLFVPAGYVSGTYLSDNDIFYYRNFSNIGITPGTYVYTWGSGPTADSLTINVGSVPEPASLALLGVPAALALLRRRRLLI